MKFFLNFDFFSWLPVHFQDIDFNSHFSKACIAITALYYLQIKGLFIELCKQFHI